MGTDDGDFALRFWDIVCEYDDFLKVALAINVLLLIMLLIASSGIPRGTDSYVVMVINFFILGPLVAITFYLAFRCRRREPEKRF